MQTTLLGLAIAIILAIVAALVAPLVVDWNNYRSAFETEASRLTGLSVRVRGTIDARILPSPVITLRNVEVGGAGREPQLRAGMLELEVSLGPLLRGEVRASEMHLIAPQISLALDRSGAFDWPALSPSFRPEALSISRLNIEDGRITLGDAASGSRLVLQKLSFHGDIRSFAGPFTGDGAFAAGGETFGYRISGGRLEGAQGLKIRLGVDPSDHPLTTEIEGILAFDHGVPQFDGTLALARPVGATLASGQRVMSDPWHAGAKIEATPAAASLRDIAFQYGPEERAINFNGRAALTFGAHPHLDGAITALRVDVDRALAAPDVTHRPPLLVVKSFLEELVAGVKLPMPGEIGIGIDAMTVGGATLQSLHGAAHFDAAGWSFDRIAFHAPGFTQVNISGRLAATAQGFAFSGPAALESGDVDKLLAWLQGRSELPSAQTKALSARGDVTIASDRVAVDRLAASFDQENVEGRLAYTWPVADRPAILDAELRAAQLNLDALTTFAKAAVADDGFELPREGSLAVDVGKVTLAGVDARSVKAQIKFDAGKLQIDRLSVGALGGAALDISGRIDELSSQPRGQVTLDLDARALAGLADVVARFAPQPAETLRRMADRLTPAKVHAVLSVARAAAAGSAARLDLDGQLGLMRVTLKGDATGETSHLGAVQLRLDSQLDADDGTALMALLGLDRLLAVDQLPGRLTLSAEGPLNGDMRVDSHVSASGFDGAIRGVLRLTGQRTPWGTLQILATAADPRPLRQMMTGQPGDALAVTARAGVVVAGSDLSFNDMAVAVGKASLHGRLAVNLSDPIGIDGDIEADNVDAASVTAMLLGFPAQPPGAGALWSSAPFGAGAFAPMNGAVTFRLDRAAFTPALVASDLKGVARFRPSEITLSDIDGSLAGGRLTGELALRRDADGLAAHARIGLAGADAAAVTASRRNGLDGRLTLNLQCDGNAQNPAALIGSLRGSGAVKLDDGHFAGLDPAAFDTVMHAADQNSAIDIPRIQAAVSAAMANGHLAVAQGDAALTMASGKINLASTTLQAQDGAELSLNGALDLNTGTIDARMTLSGRSPPNALIDTRPELGVALTGPLAAPARTLDVSALAGWLTLRAAELQTRRIESIEANRRAGAVDPVVRPQSPVVRVAPAGAVVDSEIQANAVQGPGARGLDRLQPIVPQAVPDGNRVGSGNAPAPPLPAPIEIKPIAPRPPPAARTNNGNASAGAPDQVRRSAPPQTPPAAPQPPQTAPAGGSGLDFLFRPQH